MITALLISSDGRMEQRTISDFHAGPTIRVPKFENSVPLSVFGDEVPTVAIIDSIFRLIGRRENLYIYMEQPSVQPKPVQQLTNPDKESTRLLVLKKKG